MNTTVDGLSIEYMDRGAGPVLLFLHGWAAPLEAYEPILSLLEKKYRVLAPQMPGSGLSQEPEKSLELEDYGAFVLSFLQKMGVSAQVLMGHSHGGRVSLWLMGTGKLRPKKCVLMDAAGVREASQNKPTLALRLYKACKKLAENKYTAPFFKDLYEELRDKRASADYKAASPVMRGTLSNVIRRDLRPLMPSITTEILLLWGENDTATPISDAKQMAALLPNAGLAVVPGAGHFPYVEDRARTLAILSAYLEV